MDLKLAAQPLHSCGLEDTGGVAATSVHSGRPTALESDKDDYNCTCGANSHVSSLLSHCVLCIGEGT
eukprot:2281965-Ditylum_brightwellii.AAC.1